MNALQSERERLAREVREAREALARQNNFAKAEAVGRVVDRILCFFREPGRAELPKRPGPKPDRVLKLVRFEPRVSGYCQHVRVGGWEPPEVLERLSALVADRLATGRPQTFDFYDACNVGVRSDEEPVYYPETRRIACGSAAPSP